MKTTTILLALCILFSVQRVNSQALTVYCDSYPNDCGSTGPPNGIALAIVNPPTTGPYTYHWWPTGAVHVANSPNDTVFGMPAAGYWVTVTDGYGVTGSCSGYVTAYYPSLDYELKYASLPCAGTSTGTLILSTYGGNATPGPFSFLLQDTISGQTWGPHIKGCTFTFPTCGAVDTFKNIPAGNYVSILTNAQGCTGSVSVTLPNLTPPVYSLSITSAPACGSGTTGTIITHFIWENGIPPNIGWSHPWGSAYPVQVTNALHLVLYSSIGTFIASHSYTDTIFSNISPGNYEVRAEISGLNGLQCYDSYPVSVTVSPLPSAIITPSGPLTFCQGESVQLNVPSGGNKTYQWKKGGVNIAGATLSSYTATAGGTYKVTVTNTVTGCSKTTASGTVVTVNPAPSATITPQGPTTFCAGGSVLLKGNFGTGLTYQWKKGGTNITGATAKNYTATMAGVYKVKVTNSYGCGKLSAGVTVTVPCREEIEELSSSSPLNVSVFPNPANSEINVFLSSNDNFEIEIVNTLGERIIKLKNQKRIDISKLPNGIYFVKVFCRNIFVTEKFIKE